MSVFTRISEVVHREKTKEKTDPKEIIQGIDEFKKSCSSLGFQFNEEGALTGTVEAGREIKEKAGQALKQLEAGDEQREELQSKMKELEDFIESADFLCEATGAYKKGCKAIKEAKEYFEELEKKVEVAEYDLEYIVELEKEISNTALEKGSLFQRAEMYFDEAKNNLARALANSDVIKVFDNKNGIEDRKKDAIKKETEARSSKYHSGVSDLRKGLGIIIEEGESALDGVSVNLISLVESKLKEKGKAEQAKQSKKEADERARVAKKDSFEGVWRVNKKKWVTLSEYYKKQEETLAECRRAVKDYSLADAEESSAASLSFDMTTGMGKSEEEQASDKIKALEQIEKWEDFGKRVVEDLNKLGKISVGRSVISIGKFTEDMQDLEMTDQIDDVNKHKNKVEKKMREVEESIKEFSKDTRKKTQSEIIDYLTSLGSDGTQQQESRRLIGTEPLSARYKAVTKYKSEVEEAKTKRTEVTKNYDVF